MAKQSNEAFKTVGLAFTMVAGALTLLLWYLVDDQGHEGLQVLLTFSVVATSIGGVVMGLAYGSDALKKKVQDQLNPSCYTK